LIRPYHWRTGPESDLIDSFFAIGGPRRLVKNPHLLIEPNLPVGQPDVVLVSGIALKNIDMQFGVLSAEHLRLLHHVYSGGSRTLVELSNELSVSESVIRKRVSSLVDANIIRMCSNGAIARLSKLVFPFKKIISIEAKVKNWKGAIEQARKNKWFSSESYILMPKMRNIDSIISEASKCGVGVIICSDLNVDIVLAAPKIPIPSSVGSWFVVSRIFSQMETEP